MSVLEEEITGDIYTDGSDMEDDNEKAPDSTDAKRADLPQDHAISMRNEYKMQNVETRLPGQVI